MKTNEALEKIYLNIDGDGIHYYTEGIPCEREYIEYIQTDAFIEKVCKFLKSYRQDTHDGTGYIEGIVNDETIDDFKNYMKGE